MKQFTKLKLNVDDYFTNVKDIGCEVNMYEDRGYYYQTVNPVLVIDIKYELREIPNTSRGVSSGNYMDFYTKVNIYEELKTSVSKLKKDYTKVMVQDSSTGTNSNGDPSLFIKILLLK